MLNAEFIKQVEDEVIRLTDILEIGWDVRVGDPDKFDFSLGEEGYIARQDDEFVATVYVDPRADRWQISRIVCHELLHLVLCDLEFIACNGRSIEIMELYQRFQEQAISVLVGAITGNHIWQPIRCCPDCEAAQPHAYGPQ